MTRATILLDNLRIYAHHGVLSQEHTVGAWFRISLKAEINCLPKAYDEDQLEGTVNYADIVTCIQEQMDIPSKLLEHLVHRTGQSLMKKFPLIKHLSLAIAKENPPMKAQCDEIGIKMLFSRE